VAMIGQHDFCRPDNWNKHNNLSIVDTNVTSP
jgi:hypothetical protein